MKTNIISFNGPTGCGKSTYIEKLKRILASKGYTSEVIHTDGTESVQTMEDKIAYVVETYAPRFLLIHHCGSHPDLAGMEVAFIHRDGAMDLWAALHGYADSQEVGKEVAEAL